MDTRKQSRKSRIMCTFLIIIFCFTSVSCKREGFHEIPLLNDNYGVYYEIFPYSFSDSNQDGIGDIQGIINRLDYLNDGDNTTDIDLGINGIWLMPIMQSTTYHKYDVVNYYEIDREYGDMSDFEELVEECHKRDIKIIIDLVMNHTSTQHIWFQTATDYLTNLEADEEYNLDDCPYVEYYHFAYGKPLDGVYYQVGQSNWYYEAVFWDQMPDLALENPIVRKELEKVAAFWIDKGVDGFRLDAAKEFFSGQISKNIEVLNWFETYVTSIKDDIYVVAEVWDSFGTIEEMYQSGITSMFNFPIARNDGKIAKTINKQGKGSDAISFANAMITIQNRFTKQNPNFIDAPFLSNHDLPRTAGYFNYEEDKLKMAAGLLLLMNGNPFLYYGEEIGLGSVGSKDESKRIPMYWTKEESNEICVGPKDMEVFLPKFDSVEEQLKDSASILSYYKSAIRLRNENPEIARGEVAIIEEYCKEDIFVITKEWEGSQILICVNLGEAEEKISLYEKNENTENIFSDFEIYSQLSVNGEQVVQKGNDLILPNYSIAILRKK